MRAGQRSLSIPLERKQHDDLDDARAVRAPRTVGTAHNALLPLVKLECVMRLQGLQSRPRRGRLPKEDDAGKPAGPAFAAERPNQKWIADFTHLWTAEGWLYVAAAIDLSSRRVVGWSMSAAIDGATRDGCAVSSGRSTVVAKSCRAKELDVEPQQVVPG
jgi:transposase InsO family protein